MVLECSKVYKNLGVNIYERHNRKGGVNFRNVTCPAPTGFETLNNDASKELFSIVACENSTRDELLVM